MKIISNLKNIFNNLIRSEHEEGHSHGGHNQHHEENNSKAFVFLMIRISATLLLVILSLLNLSSGKFNLAFCVCAFIIISYDVIIATIKNMLHGDIFNEETLMVIAGIAAISIGERIEGVAVILLYQVGEYLQDRAVGKSRSAVKELIDMRPDTVNRLKDGIVSSIPAEHIKVGDLFIIAPGERIPIDGKIVGGESELDTSPITGESLPQTVSTGDNILSGCINLTGKITVEAMTVFAESTVSRIIELVDNAEQHKGNSEKFITKFARIYTPAVFAFAAVIAFAVPLVFKLEFFEWIKRGLTVLVISCPCSLVISVPLTYYAGIGGACKKGFIFKGADVIDRLCEASTVVFDKTGTLTNGTFDVIEINPEPGVSENVLLTMAAYAESPSSHPIAKSIIKRAAIQIRSDAIEKCNEIRGKGIAVVMQGGQHMIIAGNARYISSFGVKIQSTSTVGTQVFVIVDKKYIGNIVLGDTLKKTALSAITKLRGINVDRIIMLTGDNENVASEMAKKLGVDEYYSECMPEDKAKKIAIFKDMQEETEKTVFVGDGINDVPVLTTADIGIAMGGLGSDAAIEAADIVIMDDDPEKVSEAIIHSKFSKKLIKENIAFSLLVKAVIMVFGISGLAPMWLAIIADVGVCLLCVLNAIRALGKNIKIEENSSI